MPIYNIPAGGASKANQVKYDNTESQLEATNVQGAVDEINANLVLDYSESTLPLDTDIHTFLQKVLNKLFAFKNWGSKQKFNNSFAVGTLVQNDDSQTLSVQGNGGNVASVIYYDLTNVSSITVNVKSIGGYLNNTFMLYVSNNPYAYTGTWSKNTVKDIEAKTIGLNTLNVSELSGYYYIGYGVGCKASEALSTAQIESFIFD